MTWLDAVVLGAVQGITEFLPVSSSGHLVLAHALVGVGEHAASLDALLHLASLLVIMALFREELRVLVRTWWPSTPEAERARGRHLWAALILGTLPLVVVGLSVRSAVVESFHTPTVVGCMLLATAGLLWFAERRNTRMGLADQALTLSVAFGIGMAQTLAILPGMSRSGVTIAAAMMLGLTRPTAARFSFLLSIPALAGAGILGARELVEAGDLLATDGARVVVSFLVALVTTWLAVVLFLRFVRQGSLTPFAVYAMTLGIAVLLLSST